MVVFLFYRKSYSAKLCKEDEIKPDGIEAGESEKIGIKDIIPGIYNNVNINK